MFLLKYRTGLCCFWVNRKQKIKSINRTRVSFVVLTSVLTSGKRQTYLFFINKYNSPKKIACFLKISQIKLQNHDSLLWDYKTKIVIQYPVFSAYSVLKFMIVWMLVLLADFVLEFRLEYLWPCWLFLGTVYTTFHCHGLVGSMQYFGCIVYF